MLFEQLRPDISSCSRGRGLSPASWATEMFSPLEGIKEMISPKSVWAKGLIIISNEASLTSAFSERNVVFIGVCDSVQSLYLEYAMFLSVS